MKKIAQIRVAKPCTGSPNANFLMMMTIIMINAIRQLATPRIEEIVSGAVENAKKPSSA